MAKRSKTLEQIVDDARTETIQILIVRPGAMFLSTQVSVPAAWRRRKESWLMVCKVAAAYIGDPSYGVKESSPVFIGYPNGEMAQYTLGELKHELEP